MREKIISPFLKPAIMLSRICLIILINSLSIALHATKSLESIRYLCGIAVEQIDEWDKMTNSQKVEFTNDYNSRIEFIKILDHSYEIFHEILDNNDIKTQAFNSPHHDEILKFVYVFSDIHTSPLDSASLEKVVRHNPKDVQYGRWDAIFQALELNNSGIPKARIEENISVLTSHNLLQDMSFTEDNYMTPYLSDRANDLISSKLYKIETDNFVYYQSSKTKKQIVKGIMLYTDNDFFTFSEKDNQDRELTGGASFEIVTDYLNLSGFNLSSLFDLFSSDEILKYRTFGLGLEFYTPYIRYRDNFQLADTLFQHDRPFSSYVYLHRSEHRLWSSGKMRNSSSFQIGKIGTSLGENIQATIHEDAVVLSQRVYGWDNQIADGGRWLFQYNFDNDILLYSTTNKYKSIFSTKRNAWDRQSKIGFNAIHKFRFEYGGYNTSIGTGIKFSTLNFMQSSGRYMIQENKSNPKKINMDLSIEVFYKHVIHNTSLEGFGYSKTFRNDEFDDEATTSYTVNNDYYNQFEQNASPIDAESFLGLPTTYPRAPAELDNVNRNIFIITAGLKLRYRKATIFFNYVLTEKEYMLDQPNYTDLENLVAPRDLEYYKTVVIPALEYYNSRRFYGHGRLGTSIIIE